MAEHLMTTEEMDQLADRVVHLLRHEDGFIDLYFGDMPPEQHRKHHHIYEAWIKEKQTRAARNEEIRRHVMKWGIVGVIMFTCTAIWQYIKHLVKGS